MTWMTSSKSMREYLQSCLSCPPSMYPTLLGLRLVTDITVGRPQPLDMAAQLRAICHDPWLLVWSKPVAAVGTAALTLALKQGQQQLMAAGQPLCKDPGPGPGLAGGEDLHPPAAIISCSNFLDCTQTLTLLMYACHRKAWVASDRYTAMVDGFAHCVFSQRNGRNHPILCVHPVKPQPVCAPVGCHCASRFVNSTDARGPSGSGVGLNTCFGPDQSGWFCASLFQDRSGGQRGGCRPHGHARATSGSADEDMHPT
ncbi:hypothetical protein HaLaN_09452, partial [Haematococcus lacustris]